MIPIIIIIIILAIVAIIFALKLSELDDELQNLYELLSDYQMRENYNITIKNEGNHEN